MKHKIYIYFLVIFSYTSIFSQGEDLVWIMGNHGGSTLERMMADTVIKRFWPFNLNFQTDPMTVEYDLLRKSMFIGTCASIGTKTGTPFIYSHGRSLWASNNEYAIHGDTINYDEYWENFNVDPRVNFGLVLFQGMIMLPYPDHPDSVLFITGKYDLQLSYQTGFYWGVVSGYQNNEPKIVTKDNYENLGRMKAGMIKAVRHANGRDWWILMVDENNDTYFIYYLGPDGLKLSKKQQLGQPNPGQFSSGTMAFSYDGNKFANIDGLYIDQTAKLSIFDFDRCEGVLSNPHHKDISIRKYSPGQGVVFSPNGKYLYFNSDSVLYQIDLSKDGLPMKELDHYKFFQSFPDDETTLYQNTFGFWVEGPDGRHYNISSFGTAYHMHIMDYPNEEGEACNFRQHAMRISNNSMSAPNFPHYRLGPIDGSPCDTLGLDNHPIAKYRYEADSIDYLRLRFTDLSYFRPETWSWDFGDGSPRASTQSPYHTFSKPGVYNVCLTVSNENSSNTSCRTITLGTVSSDDASASRADISLFPNPVQDYLLITLGEYVPAHGQVMIYDVTGRPVITQRIYYGQNSVDMSALQAGMYVWKVMDGKREIKEGKVVKI